MQIYTPDFLFQILAFSFLSWYFRSFFIFPSFFFLLAFVLSFLSMFRFSLFFSWSNLFSFSLSLIFSFSSIYQFLFLFIPPLFSYFTYSSCYHFCLYLFSCSLLAITMTTLVLVRLSKLSSVNLGHYLGRGPLRNTKYCKQALIIWYLF